MVKSSEARCEQYVQEHKDEMERLRLESERRDKAQGVENNLQLDELRRLLKQAQEAAETKREEREKENAEKSKMIKVMVASQRTEEGMRKEVAETKRQRR